MRVICGGEGIGFWFESSNCNGALERSSSGLNSDPWPTSPHQRLRTLYPSLATNSSPSVELLLPCFTLSGRLLRSTSIRFSSSTETSPPCSSISNIVNLLVRNSISPLVSPFTRGGSPIPTWQSNGKTSFRAFKPVSFCIIICQKE